jgi:hypothetical protein
MLCHTILGKSPLVTTLFAKLGIDESLEEKCFHLPREVHKNIAFTSASGCLRPRLLPSHPHAHSLRLFELARFLLRLNHVALAKQRPLCYQRIHSILKSKGGELDEHSKTTTRHCSVGDVIA